VFKKGNLELESRKKFNVCTSIPIF
jgi:hypothetical protein